jgi:hypothetical protein
MSLGASVQGGSEAGSSIRELPDRTLLTRHNVLKRKVKVGK